MLVRLNLIPTRPALPVELLPMALLEFVKVFFNLSLMFHIYFIWIHHFRVVETSNKSESIRAFHKLFEKNEQIDSLNKISVANERLILISTESPSATTVTPTVPTSHDSFTQTVVVSSREEIADAFHKDSIVEEPKVDKEEIEITESIIESESLEEEESSNRTVNGTLPSTETEQSGTSGESEVMPSFDEWKRRMLAEQNIKGENVAHPASLQAKKGQKRRRNYASYECGAKVVAANPEAESTGRILNEQMDEYMLNPCIAKIWFVIELCETIQVTQMEIANLELFSSSPKDLNIYWSDRFPTREWTSLGGFVAQDLRSFQTFDLQQQGYGKFMKIEMLSHYGTEHYCPLSAVRVYGTSMVDEYEEMETVHHPSEDEEDRLDLPPLEGRDPTPKDLFGSAKEAVYNMVRKAARALSREDAASSGNATDSPSSQKNETQERDLVPSFPEIFEQCKQCCGGKMNQSNLCQFMARVLTVHSLQSLCNKHLCQCPLVVTADKKPLYNLEANTTAPNVSLPTVVENERHQSSAHAINSSLHNDQDPSGNVNASISTTAQTSADWPIPQPSPTEEFLEFYTVPTSDPSQEVVIQPSQGPGPQLTTEETPGIRGGESWMEEPKGTNGIAQNTQQQKESVFVRLNNRIRGLESNLSLSSQYLQELSQRYRRQMEDMQRTFDRTVATLNERDAKQQEVASQLRETVATLTRSSGIMMAERHAIYRQVYEAHLLLIVTEVIVMVTVFSLCLRRVQVAAVQRPVVSPSLYSSPLKRHGSVGNLHSMPTRIEKKRRPSGTFSPSGSYSHLMIVEPSVPIFLDPYPNKVKKKQKNKKGWKLRRSLSNPALATFLQCSSQCENRPPTRQGVPFQNLSNGVLPVRSNGKVA